LFWPWAQQLVIFGFDVDRQEEKKEKGKRKQELCGITNSSVGAFVLFLEVITI
jgi:hypothetical protein